MNGVVGPLLLIAAGVLPALVAVAATVSLWRQRRVLEPDQVQFWLRVGYLYLAIFCIATIIVTRDVDDVYTVALGWLGLPAFTSIVGLWVFSERQRMTIEEFPSPKRMHTLSIENRQELRYVTTELSNDLNRAVGAQAAMQRGGAIGRRVGREAEELERVVQRIRAAIQRCHELDARYGLHLRRVKVVVEDASYELHPLNTEQERTVEELQEAQRDLDRTLDRLIDNAVTCRASANRVLQEITWI